MSKALQIDLYPQSNKNVVVADKFKIMNSEDLTKAIIKHNAELEGKGRMMIRASGTEPKVRVMVESQNAELNEQIANDMVELIKRIDEEV